MSKIEVSICEDHEALIGAAAEQFVTSAQEALTARGRFRVALSGGSTPRGLYAVLAEAPWRERIDWSKVHVFWSDERCVPPDSQDSNYRMAYEALLSNVPVESANVQRIEGELRDAEESARAYEDTLRLHFQLKAEEVPRFDLVLLGMGADGHTASLFPNSGALEERKRLVVSTWVEKLSTYRITLTLPVLNHAALCIFLVSGEEKAATLQKIVEANGRAATLPAQLVRPNQGRLLWLVDKAAASRLQD